MPSYVIYIKKFYMYPTICKFHNHTISSQSPSRSRSHRRPPLPHAQIYTVQVSNLHATILPLSHHLTQSDLFFPLSPSSTMPGHSRSDTALIYGLSTTEVEKLAEACVEAKSKAYCTSPFALKPCQADLRPIANVETSIATNTSQLKAHTPTSTSAAPCS
jgi:hypothetical protein